MQKFICITNLVRIAIFAWIFARYWNGVNSNAKSHGSLLHQSKANYAVRVTIF